MNHHIVEIPHDFPEPEKLQSAMNEVCQAMGAAKLPMVPGYLLAVFLVGATLLRDLGKDFDPIDLLQEFGFGSEGTPPDTPRLAPAPTTMN